MFCLFVGDDLFDKVLLDEESLNIDMVWEVIDWYKQVLNIDSKTCLKRPLKNRQNKGLKHKW